jgi:hypothetical protein
MGSKPRVPGAPPPPQAPKDQADAVPLAALTAQRAIRSMFGFRSTFVSGPRGPGGPEWAPPGATDPKPPDPGPNSIPIEGRNPDGTVAGPRMNPINQAAVSPPVTTLGASDGTGPLTGKPGPAGTRVNPLTGDTEEWDPATGTWRKQAGQRGGAGGGGGH